MCAFALLVACGSDHSLVVARIDPDPSAQTGGAATASSATAGGSGGDGAGEGGGGRGPEPCGAPAPVRRYTFDGAGTEVADALGGDPGQILGGAQLAGGELVLDGDDDYVDLPNGIVSGFSETTVAVWLRYGGGPAYTRIFDFGVGSAGEDPPPGMASVGVSYLAATPATGFVPPELAALASTEGSAGEFAAVTAQELDELPHLVTVGISSRMLAIHHDGVLVASVPSSMSPAEIDDVNAWLGRSQYAADPNLDATYLDVRVFDVALPTCAVLSLHQGGPEGP